MIYKNEVGFILYLWSSFSVKAPYVAQAGYQPPMFIRQSPETALATLSPQTLFSSLNYLLFSAI